MHLLCYGWGAGLEETACENDLFTDSEAVARVTARLNIWNTVPLCLLWWVFHCYLLNSIGAQNSLRNWDRATKAWSFHPKEAIHNLGLARIKSAIDLISTFFLHFHCLELFIQKILQGKWLHYQTHLFGGGNVLTSLICLKPESATKCYD